MGDRLGNLGGETKVRWHRRCPALVRRSPMWAIKRGVDLDGVEDCAIALQVRSRGREGRRVLLGDAPSRRADPQPLRFAPIHLTFGSAKMTSRKGLGRCLKPSGVGGQVRREGRNLLV